MNSRLSLFFSTFLSLLLFCLACVLPAAADITAVRPQQDESGVYRISTAGELVGFRVGINDGSIKSYADAVLTCDINLNAENDEEDYEWDPIADGDKWYGGVFDGQGHTIEGFKITQHLQKSGTHYAGFFAKLKGGEVRSLFLDGSVEISYDVNDESHLYCGGLAGYAGNADSGENIIGCAFKGDVSVEKAVGTTCWGEIHVAVS